VRYGFEVATYVVGWIPWVGWLAPQIMIFYNFGERIVESLVVNSANWLWGPLPFGEGLGNIAEDSWDALLQLGRDEWNFWLPPLPPLPLSAQEAQTQLATAETPAPAIPPVAPPTVRPHPLRDALAELHRFFAGLDAVAPQEVVDLQAKVDPQEGVDLRVNETTSVDVTGVPDPAGPGDDLHVQPDLARTYTTPTNSVETKTDPPEGTPDPSGTTSGVATSGNAGPTQTLLGKPKPFTKKPKPADTSDSSTRPSKTSVGASNDSVGTSKGGVREAHSPKTRLNGPTKHRSAGSQSGTTASSPGPA
jgi:hypothetical protein